MMAVTREPTSRPSYEYLLLTDPETGLVSG